MFPTTILDVPVREWLMSLGIGIGVSALLVVAHRILIARLAGVSARTRTDVDDGIVALARNTRWFFFAAIAIAVASSRLPLPAGLQTHGGQLLTIVLLLQIGLWSGGLVAFFTDRSLRRRQDAEDHLGVAAIRALGIGARVLSWAVLLLVALEWAFHRDIWPIITALGAGGIALALAVQQILADLLAAIAIVFDKPFDVGDTISIDAISGTVEHVGLKTTRLRSVNGEQIVLSNADVLRARVHNWRRMSERRVVATVDASPATSPDGLARIPGIVERAVAAQANGRFQRCHLAQITDAGYRFEYVFTVLDREYAAMTAVQHAVNLELVRRFAAERIEFARPLRQV